MRKFCFVVGHDKTEPGAWCSYLNKSEYAYNKEVSDYLRRDFDIYFRSSEGGYMSKMRKLATEINPKNYDLVVELHFNSFTNSANGCETVSYKGNDYTFRMGAKFCQAIKQEYKTEVRGPKFVSQANERGFGFLSLMEAPAIIVEPFFGSHEESLKFENAGVYAQCLKDWLCS